MTTNMLVAVLVPASVTRDTIDAHLLTTPMRDLMPGIADRFRVGGEFTGAWDPTYDPHTDPANWRHCTSCDGTGTIHSGQPCQTCADAIAHRRPPATVLASWDDWAPHAGDLIPLALLLDPGWRFPPTYRRPSAPPGTDLRGASPDIWISAHRPGHRTIEWPSRPMRDGTPTGEIPREIQREIDRLRIDTTDGDPAAFDPAAWQVAVVACHRTPDADRANLPVPGSLVQITDPAYLQDEEPDQLYVVQDDFHDPYYALLRIGGDYGPLTPAHALTEIAPARITIAPLPDDTTPDLPHTTIDNDPAVTLRTKFAPNRWHTTH